MAPPKSYCCSYSRSKRLRDKVDPELDKALKTLRLLLVE